MKATTKCLLSLILLSTVSILWIGSSFRHDGDEAVGEDFELTVLVGGEQIFPRRTNAGRKISSNSADRDSVIYLNEVRLEMPNWENVDEMQFKMGAQF